MVSLDDESLEDIDQQSDIAAGLRVGRHEITAKTKDFKVIKRILRTLQNK
jgi:hypothetical protein